MRIQTALDDIVAYVLPGLAVFTERERGSVVQGNEDKTVTEHSICIFRFKAVNGWRLIYHRVSLDDQK